MSGTKIKTLLKNLKTQNETSLETFQELPLTIQDDSTESPVNLKVSLTESSVDLRPQDGDMGVGISDSTMSLGGSTGIGITASTISLGSVTTVNTIRHDSGYLTIGDSSLESNLFEDSVAARFKTDQYVQLKAATQTDVATVSALKNENTEVVSAGLSVYGSAGSSSISAYQGSLEATGDFIRLGPSTNDNTNGTDIVIQAIDDTRIDMAYATNSIQISGESVRLGNHPNGSDIELRASNNTRIEMSASDDQIEVSGTLKINVEDHGSPVEIFSVNSEATDGTLSPFIQASANSDGEGLSTTAISGDLVTLSSSTTTITSDTTTITSNLTINAQDQVVIKLEENDSYGEIFKVETVGSNARGLITAYSEAGGEGISTLTLSPHQMRVYGDSVASLSTTEAGSAVDISAGGAGSEVNVSGESISLDAPTKITIDGPTDFTGGTVTFSQQTVLGAITNINQSLELGGSGHISATYNRLPYDTANAQAYDVIGIPSRTNNDNPSTAQAILKRHDSGSVNQFFSASHIYATDSLIPSGFSVILQGGVASVSSTANSKVCAGIACYSKEYTDRDVMTSLSGIDTSNPPQYLVWVVAVGDSRFRECQGFNICNENGDTQPGDLLVTSNTPGYLMKQDDDIIRSCTVGKAMEAVTFDENGQATGVYGYLYCG